MAAKNPEHRALTITFGTVAENGPGMQHVRAAGALAPAEAGYGLKLRPDLQRILDACRARGMVTRLIPLRAALASDDMALHNAAAPAWVLVVKNFAEGLCGAPADDLFAELTSERVTWDGQALMRGRVKNKLARHNVCFSDTAQEADIAAGKGTVVPFAEVPLLAKARATLGELLPHKLRGLPAEGNDYYDFRQCGIGFHGDAERPLTVGIRLYGSDKVKIPLHFQWYRRGRPIGKRIILDLPHGAGYFMCEKATGFDWRKTANDRLTLRHAAAGEGSKKTDRFLRPAEITEEPIRIAFD